MLLMPMQLKLLLMLQKTEHLVVKYWHLVERSVLFGLLFVQIPQKIAHFD